MPETERRIRALVDDALQKAGKPPHTTLRALVSVTVLISHVVKFDTLHRILVTAVYAIMLSHYNTAIFK